jgi:CO/xanthine dehydrogenase FAD-binding subunit
MSRFRVAVPRTPADAVATLQHVIEHGGAPLVVGGGTIAVPPLSHGLLAPTDVVDLGRIGADRIEESATEVCIGATVSYQQLLDSPVVASRIPLLHRMCGGITGGIQIRNQGTLGGSAAAARPFSDAPGVLVTLDATMTVRSPAGLRQVPASGFFRGAERPDLGTAEILLAMTVPTPGPSRLAGYHKLKFAESSWPVVTASCLLPVDGTDGATLVLGGVADVPLPVPLPDTRRGARAAVTHAVTQRIAALPPDRLWSDLRAGPAYRRQVAGEIAHRAVQRALDARGDST